MPLSDKSGMTVEARLIELPTKEFFVEWVSSDTGWKTDTRWCRVLAQTEKGAITIVKHHFYGGDRHKVIADPRRPA
jgi:hypothetical protein